MYPSVPLWAALLFVAIGLWVLTWSADKFVDGAEAVARSFGVSPFVIGMVIIGFGTSAPELAVSAISGTMGHSNLSLGNAYGSNIFNIAVILGIAALIRPVTVRPMVAFVASPLLVGISVLSCLLVCTGDGFSRTDGAIQLLSFAVVGLSGTICPFKEVSPHVLYRDLPVMVLLSLSIGIFGVNYRKPTADGRISRREGAVWLLAFWVYAILLVMQEIS